VVASEQGKLKLELTVGLCKIIISVPWSETFGYLKCMLRVAEVKKLY
jgi:hypothetical protein